MLSEIWNFVKMGLKGRMLLSLAVVTSFTFFISFPSLFLKTVALSSFIASSGLYLTVFVQKFLPGLRLSLDKRKEYSIPIPVEVAELSAAIGTTIKEVKIRDKMKNAFVRGKTMVLGMDLLKQLDSIECKAVVAHELGHVKEKHRVILILSATLLMLLPAVTWSSYSLPIFFSATITQLLVTLMKDIAIFTFCMFGLIPINWYLELRADRIAAQFVGKEPIKSALLKLSKNKIHESDETHPSTADRVKAIDEIKMSNALKLLNDL